MKKVYCGIDFHKNTCTLAALYLDGSEAQVVTKIKTQTLVQYLSNRKDWDFAIEASGGVNHVVQTLRDQKHTVRLINPNQFRGIAVTGKKTDARDAIALANALRVGNFPEVHLKSIRNRKIKSLLVCREEAVNSRVSLGAHIRGTLREYGISFPVGKEEFLEQIETKIKECEELILRDILNKKLERFKELIAEEKWIEILLEKFIGEDERIEKLQSVPGVGPLSAAALIAVCDDVSRFKDGTQFAAYLGLTPRVHASAEKSRMGSITRSGSEITRRYLIHGARAVLRYSADNTNKVGVDPMIQWAHKTVARIGQNKGTVALAHRLARICFAIMRDGSIYKGKKKKKFIKKYLETSLKAA